MPTVLTILVDGFEEIEATTPIDLLRRAGVEVTVAALGSDLRAIGRMHLTMLADTPLAAVEAKLYDCLFLPGGPGVARMRADPLVRRIVKRHADAGKWVSAICAAPLVLHDAGLLATRRYTAHPSAADELPNILSDERVVTDGKIITSRGPGTAMDFGLSLIEHLLSPAKAKDIAAAICM